MIKKPTFWEITRRSARAATKEYFSPLASKSRSERLVREGYVPEIYAETAARTESKVVRGEAVHGATTSVERSATAGRFIAREAAADCAQDRNPSNEANPSQQKTK